MEVNFKTENLVQPIICNMDNIDKYGNGIGKYTTGFDIGDPIHVRMLGTHNYDVHNFKITEIQKDYIIALHPRTGSEYKIGFNVEVSYAKELRFEPYESTSKESHWFAFLYLDKEMEKQLITYNESFNIAKLSESLEKFFEEDKLFKTATIITPEQQKAKFKIGDTVKTEKVTGKIIEIMPLKLSGTPAYKIELPDGTIKDYYEEELELNENLENTYSLEIITDRGRGEPGIVTETTFTAKDDFQAFIKVLEDYDTFISYDEDDEEWEPILDAYKEGNITEAINMIAELYEGGDYSDYYDNIISIKQGDRVIFYDETADNIKEEIEEQEFEDDDEEEYEED